MMTQLTDDQQTCRNQNGHERHLASCVHVCIFALRAPRGTTCTVRGVGAGAGGPGAARARAYRPVHAAGVGYTIDYRDYVCSII